MPESGSEYRRTQKKTTTAVPASNFGEPMLTRQPLTLRNLNIPVSPKIPSPIMPLKALAREKILSFPLRPKPAAQAPAALGPDQVLANNRDARYYDRRDINLTSECGPESLQGYTPFFMSAKKREGLIREPVDAETLIQQLEAEQELSSLEIIADRQEIGYTLRVRPKTSTKRGRSEQMVFLQDEELSFEGRSSDRKKRRMVLNAPQSVETKYIEESLGRLGYWSADLTEVAQAKMTKDMENFAIGSRDREERETIIDFIW